METDEKDEELGVGLGEWYADLCTRPSYFAAPFFEREC